MISSAVTPPCSQAEPHRSPRFRSVVQHAPFAAVPGVSEAPAFSANLVRDAGLTSPRSRSPTAASHISVDRVREPGPTTPRTQTSTSNSSRWDSSGSRTHRTEVRPQARSTLLGGPGPRCWTHLTENSSPEPSNTSRWDSSENPDPRHREPRPRPARPFSVDLVREPGRTAPRTQTSTSNRSRWDSSGIPDAPHREPGRLPGRVRGGGRRRGCLWRLGGRRRSGRGGRRCRLGRRPGCRRLQRRPDRGS